MRRINSKKITDHRFCGDSVLLKDLEYFLKFIDSCQGNLSGLSTRELECLELFSVGMSQKKIAEALSTPIRNIYYYVECMKDKLNYTSKSELFRLSKIIYN